jgi:hypothetical protein
MRRLFLSLLFVLTAAAPAFAQSYSAILSGSAEVPGPGDTDGMGFAVVTIDGTTLRYSVFAQNIGTPTAAHIHAGAPGASGDVVVNFNAGALSSGQTTITTELASQINANPAGFYVNVHTAEFPNGAIRGQLVSGAAGEGSRTLFIPVVGKVTGANNTNFVTDLRVINNGAVSANVTFDFYATSGSGQNSPSVTKNITVAPGEQKVLNDFVGTTLATSGLGGLAVTADQNVVVSARVINDLRATNLGTAGFAVDGAEEGERSGTIAFLTSNNDFRTNMGYFNPGSSSATATFVARRSSDGAVLGTNTVNIPGHAMVQQPAFSLISAVPEASRTQNDYYVTWTSTAPLFVYGAVTDNKTGDAVLNQ